MKNLGKILLAVGISGVAITLPLLAIRSFTNRLVNQSVSGLVESRIIPTVQETQQYDPNTSQDYLINYLGYQTNKD